MLGDTQGDVEENKRRSAEHEFIPLSELSGNPQLILGNVP